MSKKPRSTFKTLAYTASFLLVTVAYNNCGNFSSDNGQIAASSSAPALNGDIVPLPNTKTTSVIRASRVLDNLVSCLGTVEPSSTSKQEWERNRGTISEEGLANTISQPMVKSMVGIAAHVCNDLIQKEASNPPGERRIFQEVDLDNGGFGYNQLVLVSRRLARSCWGRNPTDDEISTITRDIASSFSGDEDNRNTTRNKAIYLCTSMASSFSTYEM